MPAWYKSEYRLSGLPFAMRGDGEVWIGDVACLCGLEGAGVVVSLCRVGRHDVAARIEHRGVRLIDQADPEENPNLDWILSDLAG
jgi:hypothetical protein